MCIITDIRSLGCKKYPRHRTLSVDHMPSQYTLNVCNYYAPAPIAGALSDDARLTSVWRLYVCLSVACIGPKSRTERPRKTKSGTDVVHVTRDSDTTFKVKRSKVNLLFLTRRSCDWAACLCVSVCEEITQDTVHAILCLIFAVCMVGMKYVVFFALLETSGEISNWLLIYLIVECYII